MKLAWLTDIRLNFLRPAALEAFLDMLSGTETDGFIITGDIGEAHDIALHLNAIDNAVQRPVYFVLGTTTSTVARSRACGRQSSSPARHARTCTGCRLRAWCHSPARLAWPTMTGGATVGSEITTAPTCC
jgi:hypothetical protein